MKKTSHYVLAALLFALLSGSGALAGAAPADRGDTAEAAPVAVVAAFHESLLAAMKADGYEARLAIVAPAVASRFRVATIARISLGRNWRSLSDEEKAGFQALMMQLIATTYASRFSGYDGQVFSGGGTGRIIGRDRTRVKTTLTTKSETVALDYSLERQDGEWRIYDIVANGVSDLSLKRSNYTAIFRQDGLAGVEAELRRSIDENAAGE